MWKKDRGQGGRSNYPGLRLRAAATGVFALVWWGLLYPELCFTEDTFQLVTVTDGKESVAEDVACKDILEAAGDEIVIGSRLLEWLEEKKWFWSGG